MITLILVAIAAIFNAAMDRLENESFYSSIFRNRNEKFWYKRISWKYAKRILGYKIDAWHLCKSGMVICMALAAIQYKILFTWYWDFLLIGLVWNVTFNIFYDRILKHGKNNTADIR